MYDRQNLGENHPMSQGKDSTIVYEQASSSATSPSSAEAVLVQLHPPGIHLGRRYPLNVIELVVGREGEVDLLLEYASVSRRQAKLYLAVGTWFVEDIGSTNGTFVNEQRVQTRALQNNDLIRFGEVTLKFLVGSNMEAAYHEEIYRISIQDGLTGAYSKRYFLEFLEQEIARSLRYGSPLGLVIFDIDHFKRINDTFGHPAGDAVLKELTRRLMSRIRQTDLLVRYGGEEFAVALPGTRLDGAAAAAEFMRQLVQTQPVAHENIMIPVTISLGVASLEPAGERAVDAQELIRRADEKLYAAKHLGRNRVVW
jgi:two-component system, cell cycle response regulator